MTAPTREPVETATDRIEVSIGGMTCAACATRIEKRLNKLEGATAVVNYATERAVVTGLSAEATPTVLDTVVRAGYTATPVGDDDTGESNHPARLRSLRIRLLVAAILTLPLSNLTIALALIPELRFPYWEWLCIALATPVVTWAAWPFHRATLNNLRHRTFSMDTLVSLGIGAAYGWSVVATILGPEGGPGYWVGIGVTPAGADTLYLEVAAAVTTFLLIGRYFEARARRSAADVLGALRGLAATRARVRRDDGTESIIPVTALRAGEVMIIRPGETVPADGTVIEGRSSLDVAMMTGEPLPRDAEPGSTVLGGTINLTGALGVRADQVGPRSQLEQMAALAEQAQARKARVQKLVDRVVAVFVPAVLIIAAATLAGWLISGAPVRDAFSAALAVVIIACPCALGLATPTALMVGVGRAGQLGIVIKGPDALEASGAIDTVVLDKTGTLTAGRLRLTESVGYDGLEATTGLAMAAAVEGDSEHPVGVALREALRTDPGPPDTGPAHPTTHVVSGFAALPGLGATAELDGATALIGNAALFAERGVALPDAALELDARAADRGHSCVHLAVDDRVVAGFTLADEIRDSARPAIDALRSLGLRTVMLTGDAAEPARRVADDIGVDEVIAGVLPSQKATTIADLQARGRRVAMVGDGINDAAALATADLGIAVVTGTDLALRSADIIVVRRHLGVVADAVELSRRTLRTIRGNLAWAFGYNIAAIPLAASGWLNPLIAGFAMSFSSIFVVSNSLRLRSYTGVSDAATDRPDETGPASESGDPAAEPAAPLVGADRPAP